MKAVYIMLVIVLAAAALGCVGNNGPGTSSKTPPTPSPTSQPSSSVTETEVLDIGNELTDMDAMFNETSLDISFSDISVDTLN